MIDYTMIIIIEIKRDDETCFTEKLVVPSYSLDLKPEAEDTLKQKICGVAWEMFINAKRLLGNETLS